MLGFFAQKPLLDEGTTQWLFDAYAWALEQFDSRLFLQRTELVTPTDKYFPDRSDNALEMANGVFARVLGYAGMQQWPCSLTLYQQGEPLPALPTLAVEGTPRGGDCRITTVTGEPVSIAFDPSLARKPELMVAFFARELGGVLGRSVAQPPPGGEEYRGHAADLLAIFMGFGLFMANNAFSVQRGGCGGCGGSTQVFGALTEDEMTYALAIFCTLKSLDGNEVEPHLKKTLQPFFRKAMKEVSTLENEIGRLMAPASRAR